MSAVLVQKLQCDSCAGPLPWDGATPVVTCPQCATPHAMRWSAEGTPVAGRAPAAGEATPAPDDQLRRLESAWKRTDAQFFEQHDHTWRALVNMLGGLALFCVGWLVLTSAPRWGFIASFAAPLVAGCVIVALIRRSALRRRTAEWEQAHRLYQEQKERLTAQLANARG